MERHGTQRRLRRVTVPIILFDDKMINFQRIQLKFSQLTKHLLIYIPYII